MAKRKQKTDSPAERTAGAKVDQTPAVQEKRGLPETTPAPPAKRQRALTAKASSPAPATPEAKSPPERAPAQLPPAHLPAGPRPRTNGLHQDLTVEEVGAAEAPPEPYAAIAPLSSGGDRPATTWFAAPRESCEIALWRGFMRARFYARPRFPEARDHALEVSPMFRMRGETPMARGAALAAYEALIEKLVLEGWQPSGLGGTWYEQWFRRGLRAPTPRRPRESRGEASSALSGPAPLVLSNRRAQDARKAPSGRA